MEKRIRFTIILVLILIVVIAFSFQSKEKKEYLVYNEALDKTAVTVDDVSLTLKDIAFYVAYEEKTVQEQAILYNPDNPRQYWNVYTDGQFVKLTAKARQHWIWLCMMRFLSDGCSRGREAGRDGAGIS